MSTTTKPSYGQPALIGGLVMGVLSALPLVSVVNLCCCGWVIAGGMVAAYILQQNQTTAIEVGDGALVGLLAGLVGALAQVAISIPIDLMVGPFQQAMVERVLDATGATMRPEVRDMLERYGRNGPRAAAFLVVAKFFSLFFWLFIGAVFSTIGGVLGALIFKKNTPPGVIDVPPASA